MQILTNQEFRKTTSPTFSNNIIYLKLDRIVKLGTLLSLCESSGIR